VLSFINRLIEQSYLVKLPCVGYLSVDLPIELLILDPVLVKWVVVQVVGVGFFDFCFEAALDKICLLSLALKVKQGLHWNRCEVESPLHCHLDTLDVFSHKVSAEEETNLGVELFLTDLSN
jgi:hypothetical protein